ncbi:MAG: hypothetical protein DBX00_06105 [Verrucomicrobia bacterium]|nr:MAG: hypothetical protein DBX00_06105 [Verrucomicrobiota bacterium]
MKELESEVEFCRRIMKSWEKLRLLYNGALLFPGIVLLWRILHLQAERMAQNPPGMGFPIMDPVTLFISALLFGICANVCFCLGPYSEFIVIALGFPLTARKIRVLLFSLGLMISLGIIILVWFLVEFSLSFPSPP